MVPFDGSMDSFLIVAFIAGIIYAIFTLNFKSLAWFLSIPTAFFLLSKINRLLGKEHILIFMILFISLCLYCLFAIMKGLDALGGRSEKDLNNHEKPIDKEKDIYRHKYNQNKYANSEKIFIDDEFYPSQEKQNANNKQDKNETISSIQNTTHHGQKEMLVYEHLSPQDIENLQEILDSTNPDTPRIIKCHNCGSKLRVPAHKKIEITCPHCKATRRLAT